jgi:hypothetical protein
MAVQLMFSNCEDISTDCATARILPSRWRLFLDWTVAESDQANGDGTQTVSMARKQFQTEALASTTNPSGLKHEETLPQ